MRIAISPELQLAITLRYQVTFTDLLGIVNFSINRHAFHKKRNFPLRFLINKCNEMHMKLRILSHLLKKSLMENFMILCCNACFLFLHLLVLICHKSPS